MLVIRVGIRPYAAIWTIAFDGHVIVIGIRHYHHFALTLPTGRNAYDPVGVYARVYNVVGNVTVSGRRSKKNMKCRVIHRLEVGDQRRRIGVNRGA